MLVYYFLLAWIILAGVLLKFRVGYGDLHIISGRLLYIMVTFIPLTIVMCFRGVYVGTDTHLIYINEIWPYIASFNSFSDLLNAPDTKDYVYYSAYYFLQLLSQDDHFLIFCESLIIMIGMAVFLYRTSTNLLLSAIIFFSIFFFWAMNNNRQAVSLMFILNSWYFLYKDIISKKGWLLFIIGVGCHASSLIFLMALISAEITKRNISYRKIIFVTSIVSIAISCSALFLIKQFMAGLPPMYQDYLLGNSAYNFLNGVESSFHILGVVFIFFILAYIFSLHHLDSEKDDMARAMLPSLIFMTTFYMVFNGNELTVRALMSIEMLFLIFIPCVVNRYKEIPRLVGSLIVVVAFSVRGLYLAESGVFGVIPYVFFE